MLKKAQKEREDERERGKQRERGGGGDTQRTSLKGGGGADG